MSQMADTPIPTDANLYQVMSSLRAVRRLKPDPIPHDVLERVLQAACWAPTGGNQQPWKVIVVTRPDLKQGLADLYKPEWVRFRAGYTKRMEAMPEGERERFGRTLVAGDHLADHLGEAPALLVFVCDFARMAITDAKLDRISIIGGASVYPPVHNLMLACVAEGLGCTLTTLHCFKEPEVQALLGIPAEWATAALVPIGYPVLKGHGPINRKGPEDLAYADTFGTAWS